LAGPDNQPGAGGKNLKISNSLCRVQRLFNAGQFPQFALRCQVADQPKREGFRLSLVFDRETERKYRYNYRS
jgi:hypothetical protein